MIKYVAAQHSAQKYVQVPWSLRLGFDVHTRLEYKRGGQIESNRGEKYKAVGGGYTSGVRLYTDMEGPIFPSLIIQ